MSKKVLLLGTMLALATLANGQARYWNLNGAYMDCSTGTPGSPSTSGSYQRFLHEMDASSFAVPGLCETYTNLSWAVPGRANSILLNHITEGYSPSLPGFLGSSKNISSAIGTVYSDNGSYVAGKLQSDGKRPLYGRQGNDVYRLCYLLPDGNTSGTPAILYIAPGPSGIEFDRWTAMEASADGYYLLLVGNDAKYILLYDLRDGTSFTLNAPGGGTHSRIQGFEYVPAAPGRLARLYISHNSKNAANPSGTGGIGYYTLDPLSVLAPPYTAVTAPAGTTATDFGFSEIEFAMNNKLYLARNTSGSYDFSSPGTVYSLDLSGNWAATSFSIAATDNTSYSATCDKYYIQTQIDGENYNADYYTAPAIAAGTVEVKGIAGASSAPAAPTIYRCGTEPLILKATVTGLMKEYDYVIDAGPSAGPLPSYIHLTGTVTSSAGTLELQMDAILPSAFVTTDWIVTLTPKGACSTTGTAVTIYFKVRPISVVSEFKKAGCSGSCAKPIQTSPNITTPAPAINSAIGTFRNNVDAAQGWVGATSAGMIDIDANGAWAMRVYEVDPTTGLRMVRSGITAPTIALRTGTGPLATYTRFNDFTLPFDEFNPPFYFAAGSAYGDDSYFNYFYEMAFDNGTLTEFSSRVYCAELEVTESVFGCTSTTRSFFRIANNGPYPNGKNAKPTGIGEEEAVTAVVNIYPNPAHSGITVDLPSTIDKATFLLMDNTGRKVMENTNLLSGQNKISIQHLPSGVYFYEINNHGTLQHGKLVKQ